MLPIKNFTGQKYYRDFEILNYSQAKASWGTSLKFDACIEVGYWSIEASKHRSIEASKHRSIEASKKASKHRSWGIEAENVTGHKFGLGVETLNSSLAKAGGPRRWRWLDLPEFVSFLCVAWRWSKEQWHWPRSQRLLQPLRWEVLLSVLSCIQCF